MAVQRRALVTHKPISWVSSFRSTARGGHEDLLFEMLDDGKLIMLLILILTPQMYVFCNHSLLIEHCRGAFGL